MDKFEVVELGTVRSSTWDAELGKVIRPQAAGIIAGQVRVVFGSTHGKDGLIKTAERIGQNSTNLPADFLKSLPKDLNGSFGMRNTQASDNSPDGSSLWYSFKVKQMNHQETRPYFWEQVVSFVKSDAKGNALLVLCLDCPDNGKVALKEKLKTVGTSSSFEWHTIFLEVMRDRYDKSVWSLRDRVRNAERGREPAEKFNADFVYLHEIARHVFHSNETLDVAIDTIKRLLNSCERLLPPNISDDPPLFDLFHRISTLEKDVQSIKRRSESLTERLQNEINLAYNLVGQRDNQIMVQMGERARQDNNNMKLIAVVGLVYLPGTFVSSLFGMNFFSFDEENGQQRWGISKNFWLYWAITVPLTLCTMVIWALANHGDLVRWRLRALTRFNARVGK